MSRIKYVRAAVLLLVGINVPASASAQLAAAKEGAIVYGHHHLYVSNVDEARKFWLTLGGAPLTFGPFQGVKLPNLLILMTPRAPTAGSKGSTADHVGLNVRNLGATLDAVRAAGYPLVTKEEMPPGIEAQYQDGVAFLPARKLSVAFVMGPEGMKVELVENKDMTVPVALGHLHLFTQDPLDMKAWYEKVFGPKLPGVMLAYQASTSPVVGTKGRVVDHIGFEVRDLESFCRKLEAMGIKFDRPFGKNAALNLALAFISDPWGTSIELTEGLDKIE